MMRYQLRYVRVSPAFVGDGESLPDAKIAGPITRRSIPARHHLHIFALVGASGFAPEMDMSPSGRDIEIWQEIDVIRAFVVFG
ncbi:hypothetical protein [Micromonospora sp. NPDC048830]|uniref:hypothetical protein n=1 Tax=Micromonospora sp. NPDC048830 TaxID=3364257 RepID=UPI00371C3FDE